MSWSAAAVASLLAFAPAAAQSGGDSPYVVAKVSVDVTSKSAVDAKAKAMAEAEQRALAIVLRRVAPFGALAQLPALGPQQAEGLMDGLSIRSEKMSSTRYIASFDISFKEQAIKEMLAGYGVPVNEGRAPSILILPLVLDGDKVRSAGEGWQAAWLDLDVAHGLTPATVVQPREELDAGLVAAALAGDRGAYARVKRGYADQPLVLAVGQPVEGGKFISRLVGTDSVGRVNYGRSVPLKKDRKATEREEAEFALALLESRWKAMQPQGGSMVAPAAYGQEGAPSDQAREPQGEPERNVMALVKFSGLKQWQEIRSRLMYVPGLQALEVNSLSARGASVTFDYAGSLGHLQQVLAENGFSFESSDQSFVIRAR